MPIGSVAAFWLIWIDTAPRSSMKPQANLRAGHAVALSADICRGNEGGKMEAIQADDLFATAGVGLPAELENEWVGGEWEKSRQTISRLSCC
jgi:hypothetical protein